MPLVENYGHLCWELESLQKFGHHGAIDNGCALGGKEALTPLSEV